MKQQVNEFEEFMKKLQQEEVFSSCFNFDVKCSFFILTEEEHKETLKLFNDRPDMHEWVFNLKDKRNKTITEKINDEYSLYITLWKNLPLAQFKDMIIVTKEREKLKEIRTITKEYLKTFKKLFKKEEYKEKLLQLFWFYWFFLFFKNVHYLNKNMRWFHYLTLTWDCYLDEKFENLWLFEEYDMYWAMFSNWVIYMKYLLEHQEYLKNMLDLWFTYVDKNTICFDSQHVQEKFIEEWKIFDWTDTEQENTNYQFQVPFIEYVYLYFKISKLWNFKIDKRYTVNEWTFKRLQELDEKYIKVVNRYRRKYNNQNIMVRWMLEGWVAWIQRLLNLLM